MNASTELVPRINISAITGEAMMTERPMSRAGARVSPARIATYSKPLSAPMPSFVDADRAMQDPVVRERVTAPAQPTAPDLQLAGRLPRAEGLRATADLWYLRYRNGSGRWINHVHRTSPARRPTQN